MKEWMNHCSAGFVTWGRIHCDRRRWWIAQILEHLPKDEITKGRLFYFWFHFRFAKIFSPKKDWLWFVFFTMFCITYEDVALSCIASICYYIVITSIKRSNHILDPKLSPEFLQWNQVKEQPGVQFAVEKTFFFDSILVKQSLLYIYLDV